MIYLKADDEATFTTALKTAGWAWDTEYRVEVDLETEEETVTEDVVREAGMEEYSATQEEQTMFLFMLPKTVNTMFSSAELETTLPNLLKQPQRNSSLLKILHPPLISVAQFKSVSIL